MAASQPAISVVIAVRNGAATLQRALDSVFEQTYPKAELIVIDGASTDGTVEILKRNADRLHFWESEPDRGIYHAWNKALDHATGDWICFLGADDRFHHPGALMVAAPYLLAARGHQRVVYGRIDVVNERGDVIHTLGGPWDRAEFIDHMSTPHPATFHSRQLFDRHGRFDESYRIAGDYEFLLRELLESDAAFIPEVITDMSTGGLSDPVTSEAMLIREAHRAQHAHGLKSAPAWRSGLIIRRTVRDLITRIFGPRAARSAGSMYRFLSRAVLRRDG